MGRRRGRRRVAAHLSHPKPRKFPAGCCGLRRGGGEGGGTRENAELTPTNGQRTRRSALRKAQRERAAPASERRLRNVRKRQGGEAKRERSARLRGQSERCFGHGVQPKKSGVENDTSEVKSEMSAASTICTDGPCG